MLAMMSVVTEKCVPICFLTFYFLQACPQASWGLCNFPPPTLNLDWPGCVNNALINALKKLTQCINALKKLTL